MSGDGVREALKWEGVGMVRWRCCSGDERVGSGKRNPRHAPRRRTP